MTFPNLNLKASKLFAAFGIVCLLFSIQKINAQGLTDYTGVWWPINKEAIVPEIVIKQASPEMLVVFFFQSCHTDASGKCFWGESKGQPHSINNPDADPVQNTDEVTGAFTKYPEKVSFTLSLLDKNLLRLDLKSNSKAGVVRKVYNFKPKTAKKPLVIENKARDEVKIKDELIVKKPEIKTNVEIKKKPEIYVPANLSKGSIKGRAKGLTQHCTKYAVIVLKAGERKSRFLDPDPEDCSYRLDNLEPGKYLVSVLINYPHKDDYQILPGQIDNVVYVKAGQTANFDFTIKHRIEANNNQISGTLSNTRSCGFYQVSFYNPATRTTKTGRFDSSTCRYLVEDLAPGTYRVNLGFAGKADGIVNAEPYPQTITIGKGDRKVIHFKLK